MSMDTRDIQIMADIRHRSEATECDLCGETFEPTHTMRRKAIGPVEKGDLRTAACVECAVTNYGAKNADGDDFDPAGNVVYDLGSAKDEADFHNYHSY